MNRFFLYLIILNMMANVVAFVPKILLEEQLTGAVLAIAISIPVGTVLLFFYTKYMSKFPKQGMPEIIKGHMPRPLFVLHNLILGLMWFFAGMITQLAIADIVRRFLDPNMPDSLIVFLFFILIAFGALLETKKVLYALEIILLLNFPFIFMVFGKSFVNEYFSWDSVKIVLRHYQEVPSFVTVSSALYTFIGFINIVIFNREFSKMNLTWIWLIPIVGAANLFTTFFVPIGFYGLEGSQDLIYPWVTTADAMQMKYGFVERVIFIFLLLYIGISIISTTVHWHVALEWFKSFLPEVKWQTVNIIPIVILIIFGITSVLMDVFFKESTILWLTKGWMIFIIPVQLLGIGLLAWVSRRERR